MSANNATLGLVKSHDRSVSNRDMLPIHWMGAKRQQTVESGGSFGDVVSFSKTYNSNSTDASVCKRRPR